MGAKKFQIRSYTIDWFRDTGYNIIVTATVKKEI
jgi:hypothetical protein